MELLEKLKYRRQYILTNDNIENYKDWNIVHIISLKEKWTICAHPDLEVEQVSNEKKSITLLGYLIDPENPSFTNKDILNTLIGLQGLNEIIKTTDNCNGRFVLIYSCNDSVKLSWEFEIYSGHSR